MTGRWRLPTAMRRAVSAGVVLALLVLPILSRGALALATHESTGIFCGQPDRGDPGPTPDRHEDCVQSCALAQSPILPPLPKPAIGRTSHVLTRTALPQGKVRPRNIVDHRHIRGPPAEILA